jgi:hypothetical protein
MKFISKVMQKDRSSEGHLESWLFAIIKKKKNHETNHDSSSFCVLFEVWDSASDLLPVPMFIWQIT